ncbi:MAG: aminotransferase class IV [Rickettsiales bacterium]|nr:aminotransferase class IV [Rickettsiales bacterium]
MQKLILKNHQLVAEKQAQFSIDERGFLFGDGIFETCKIFNGKIYDYKAHEDRIEAGLKALKFSAEIKNLEKEALQLIAKNKIENGILKILISRGIGSAGYLPTYESKALIVAQTFAARELPKKITLGISKITAPKAFAKTTNSLPYILTKIEATEKKLFDCVMLSDKKFIAETSSANIFWVKNGKVFTASKSCGALLGTVRKKLLKISPVKIFETEATAAALKKADEIFLTNSSFLVLPVDEFLGRKLQKNFGNEFKKLLQQDVEKECQS